MPTAVDGCLDYAPWLCEKCDTETCKSYEPPGEVKAEVEVKEYKQLRLFEI